MARNFNGSSDYIEGALALSYPFSVAGWFRSTSITTTQIIACAGNLTGADDDRTTLQAAGGAAGDPVRCSAVTNGGSAASVDSTTGYTANVWYHACMSCLSSTSRSVYINGGSKATTLGSRAMTGLNTFTIGAQRSAGSLGNYFSGDLAELAVWDSALSDADALSLGTGFKPFRVATSSLIFYAPLIRGVQDVVGGVALTTSGTTVTAHPRVY